MPIRQIQNLKLFASSVEMMAETVSLDHEVIHARMEVEEGAWVAQWLQSC